VFAKNKTKWLFKASKEVLRIQPFLLFFRCSGQRPVSNGFFTTKLLSLLVFLVCLFICLWIPDFACIIIVFQIHVLPSLVTPPQRTPTVLFVYEFIAQQE
jgi:hypothetical protein